MKQAQEYRHRRAHTRLIIATGSWALTSQAEPGRGSHCLGTGGIEERVERASTREVVVVTLVILQANFQRPLSFAELDEDLRGMNTT